MIKTKKSKIWNWSLFITLAMSLMMNSCLVPKKVVYVEDMLIDTTYRIKSAPALRVQKNDRLRIVIGARNPELALPFNKRMGAYTIDGKGALRSGEGANQENSFLVDEGGSIDYPILGAIGVEGMTLAEIQHFFKNELQSKQLITDPTVEVELLNLKINVLGAVNRVGVQDVPDGRINLLEVISKAGGLTANAAPDQVSVIREVDGVRQKILHDIRSADIFESPAYYLQQNDIVYVAPRVGEMTSKEQNNRTLLTTGISLATLVFTFLNWLN